MLTIAMIMMAGAGPLSKFETRTPEAEYETSAKMGDVERCILAADGLDLPMVYRQADRPEAATYVWTAKGPYSTVAALRLDLRSTSTGTHVKAWIPEKRITACAPR